MPVQGKYEILETKGHLYVECAKEDAEIDFFSDDKEALSKIERVTFDVARDTKKTFYVFNLLNRKASELAWKLVNANQNRPVTNDEDKFTFYSFYMVLDDDVDVLTKYVYNSLQH